MFAVLVPLRLNLYGQDISHRMGISEGLFSKLFTTRVAFLSKELPLLFPWPGKDRVNSWMPLSFRLKFPSTRIIIDWLEVQVQRPSSLLSQSQTYSQYKSRNTMKLLVGFSSAGAVTFLSDVWGGRRSDREITTESDLIKKDLLEPGDSVIADRGYDVEDVLAHERVLLNIPPYFNGRSLYFSENEVVQTRRIAELRIHVERAIGRARNFTILNCSLPANMASLADEICKVCFLLTNFDQLLVK